MGNGVEREGGEKELVIGKGVAWDGRIRYIGGGSLCQIQGKFKDGKFDNKNYFRHKIDVKVKTWKHINNFCCKGSKHPLS